MEVAVGMGGIETVMMRIRQVLFLASALLCSGDAVASSLVTPVDCAPRGVRVREKPSLRAHRLERLPYGQRLRTLGKRADGWYEVILRDGRHGFSCAELLREVTAAEIEFTVRFMDVPGGEATVINVGDTDILVDGGSDPESLLRYLRDGGLVRDPLELAIVTHRDIEHWNGLTCMRGDQLPFGILELWLPDRAGTCVTDVQQLRDDARSLPETCVLEHSLVVGNATLPSNCKARDSRPHLRNIGAVDVKLPFAPEVDLTVLRFPTSGHDCKFSDDDSSLVFLATIGGSRFLFTSDLRGKDDGDADTQAVQYGERELVRMTDEEPDLLVANVLKVAHHGADTSSMPEFIGCVFPERSTGPKFAVICSTHHLKDDVVVKRCEKRAFVLSTDERVGMQNGDVVCVKKRGAGLDCRHEPRLYRLLPIVASFSSNQSSKPECVPCQAKNIRAPGALSRSRP